VRGPDAFTGAYFISRKGKQHYFDLVSKKAINSGDMPAVTERARQYVSAIRAARSQLFV